jgi:transcriptional regulator with XRE-family HTH domain
MVNSTEQEIDRYLGTRLREARLLRGVTQEELGQYVGVSFQQIQKHEKGENRISAGRIYRVSRFLEIPLEFFFAENKEQPNTVCAEAIRIAAHINKLPSDSIQRHLKQLVLAINGAWKAHNDNYSK